MGWVLVSLVAVVALVAYTVFLNVRPMTCPSCKRINVFRRTKTGRRREGSDDEGDLRRRSSEYVCCCCGCRYWIVWDDFEGNRASLAEDTETRG
jgi:hypothetical protein